MTDLEISKALALSIGWPVVFSDGKTAYVDTGITGPNLPFDYRDWAVIGPIAEKFDCFPYKTTATQWVTTLGDTSRKPWPFYGADTPQKAIALAVIGAKK
jgi:hypothetical protein